ncbi:MAG: iron ABC transporter permease [Oscillospiraceae bacterium]|nr:iron ABC transporter permease [Oscillospiraceae bacterium]
MKKYTLIVIILGVLVALGIVLSFALGRYPISVEALLEIVRGGGTSTQRALFFNVRLPRILLACMVGCSISAAGASYQGVFQNPMAAPDILGASSGAAAGASVAILLQFSGRGIMLTAFAASLATIALVMAVSKAARGNKLLGIILAGIMVSSLANAVTSFVKIVADPYNTLPEITFWLLGSLKKTNLSDVPLAALPMAIGLIPLLLLRWRINLLTLSDSEARTMGVNASRTRVIVIVCATLITAASVAVSGLIGWVGLVIPHLTRRLVGNNFRHLLPASMLGGALFLLLVDDISRNLLVTEIPLGILTSVVGAPFFLWLITRKREEY